VRNDDSRIVLVLVLDFVGVFEDEDENEDVALRYFSHRL